jgi:carboxyl-terminal processing protease
MRGAPGSEVTLTLRRPPSDKLIYIKLTREVIAVASIASQVLNGGVGYLRIKTFQTGTHDEFVEAVGKLRKKAGGNLTGVLLDLRNNPGGLVDEAVAVADEFLSSGVIYTTRHRQQVIDEVRATPEGSLRTGPIVILVNGASASAAELVAGALQDNHRGPVVGARTFGKGSVQTIIDLPDGAGLRLTTMRYYTPSGRTIQSRGVDPDVRVPAASGLDKSVGLLREADLENHLPPAGPPGSPEPDAGPPASSKSAASASSNADAGASDNPTPDDTRLGVARVIPDDPTGGPDMALSIAYQIVTGVLTRKP